MKTRILSLMLAVPFAVMAADVPLTDEIPTVANTPKAAGREADVPIDQQTLTVQARDILCNKTEKILDAITNDFGEKLVWTGEGEGTTAGTIVRLTVNSTDHSWSVVETKGATSCVLGGGMKYVTQSTLSTLAPKTPKNIPSSSDPRSIKNVSYVIEKIEPRVQTMYSDYRLTMCNTIEKVIDVVSKDFKETPVWVGEGEGTTVGTMTGLTLNGDKHTWTLIETKGTTSCILGSGKNFNIEKDAATTY